jgi:hypothetical protein
MSADRNIHPAMAFCPVWKVGGRSPERANSSWSTTASSSRYAVPTGTIRLAVPQPGAPAACRRVQPVGPGKAGRRLVEVGHVDDHMIDRERASTSVNDLWSLL